MKHFFLRDAKRFPVACIATEKQDLASGTEGKIIYGISICNPLDFQNYNAKRAMKIAQERLSYFLKGRYDKNLPDINQPFQPFDPTVPDFESAKCGIVFFHEGESPKLKLLNTLMHDNDLPSRFRRAVKHEIAALNERMRLRAEQQASGQAPDYTQNTQTAN